MALVQKDYAEKKKNIQEVMKQLSGKNSPRGIVSERSSMQTTLNSETRHFIKAK